MQCLVVCVQEEQLPLGQTCFEMGIGESGSPFRFPVDTVAIRKLELIERRRIFGMLPGLAPSTEDR